jgi:hypothetical protein
MPAGPRLPAIRSSIGDDVRGLWRDAEERSRKMLQNLVPAAEELDRNAKLDIEVVVDKLTTLDSLVREKLGQEGGKCGGGGSDVVVRVDDDARRWK